MKKILLTISLIALGGCTSLDSTVTSFNNTVNYINNYSVNFILRNYEIDKKVPAFRPGCIYFAQYSPEVSETFYKELTYFASNFKKYRNPKSKILINGFVDLDEKNRGFDTLGKKRANEVRDILIRMGISIDYILVNDLGGKKYFNSNRNVIEKARNRCVTVQVFSEKKENN